MLLTIAHIAYWIVIALHLYFALLEMVLWSRLAPKVFRVTPEFAQQTIALASNQGLYNLFLVAALLIGLFTPDSVAGPFAFYGLVCVIVAGAWGAITVNRRIFFVQALPAIVALVLRLALVS